MNKLNKILWKITKYFTIPAFVLVIVASIFGDSENKTENKSEAKLVATYKNWYVVNPASGVFTVTIENTGNKIAKNISCFVSVNDGGSAYRGFGEWEAPFSIPAGETRELRGRMTITNEGSLWVNQGTAECEEK